MVAKALKTNWLAVGALLIASAPSARGGDVTYERLRAPEPRNWLMNHGDFGAHRYSALESVNRQNVKGLKLAFAVGIGGRGGNENLVATPLVEDGFMGDGRREAGPGDIRRALRLYLLACAVQWLVLAALSVIVIARG